MKGFIPGSRVQAGTIRHKSNLWDACTRVPALRFTMCIFFLSFSALFMVCSENLYNLDTMPAREKFEMGKMYFFKGDYEKAQILFDQIARLNLITENFSDSAQFLLAESHYNMKNYLLAEREYDRLIRNYTISSLRLKAQYMIAMGYYQLSPKVGLDQDYTEKAIVAFENFLANPGSQFDPHLFEGAVENLKSLLTKLAERDLKTGVLYKKMGQIDGAIKYLNYAMQSYNKYGPVPIIPQALFERGECYIKMNNYPEALESFQAIIDNSESFPDNNYTEKARERLILIKIEMAKIDTTISR